MDPINPAFPVSPLAGFTLPEAMPDPHPEVDEQSSGMLERQNPEPDPETKAHVTRLIDQVKFAKKFHAPAFKKMRDSMDFVSGKQWKDQSADSELYVANIAQRHIQQAVASLYAKNPKAICKRRKTLDFQIWDESQDSLLQAYQSAQAAAMAGLPVDPMAQSLIEDVKSGFERRKLYDRIAKTLEIVFEYSQKSLEPGFKLQMKQLVRRVLTTGIGYVKVGFQRLLTKRPEDIEKITDVTQQIAKLERLLADKIDNEYTETDARYSELKLLLQELNEGDDEFIAREGLVFDFPSSTSVIVDPKCRDIRTFLGARWIAQEFILSPDDIKEIYKVDVQRNYQQYKPDVNGMVRQVTSEDDKSADSKCVVWEIYCKDEGLKYVVCDGYPAFLEDPETPPTKLERFWPIFSLTFNDAENEHRLFPQSDVELLIPMQREYNRSRQALREQRIANRPAYATPKGMLDQEDIDKLVNRPDNAVLTLNALAPGQKVDDVIQPIRSIGIDPALYDTTTIFDDVLKVVGAQEANFGGTNSSTATQSNIAESSRSASISSKVDDLDDFLTEVARSSGQILLMNMTLETVQKIAGPGAVWPQASAQEIADELSLEIQAGSSGRPNKAAEIANFQQIAPTLLQIPGINPLWFAKEALKRMDDSLDLTEAVQEGVQSIIAQNAQKQLPTGSPENDPNQQGSKGGQNGGRHTNDPNPPPAPPNMGNMAG